MKSKWFVVLSIAFLCLQIVALAALLGCESAGGHALIDEDEEGDVVKRSKQRMQPPTTTVSSQAGVVPDMHITEWLYTEGAYTPLPGGGIPYSPTLQEHGYLGIKVPHPPPTHTGQIVRTGAYSPTAALYFRDFPLDKRYTVPLEYRGDLVSQVEARYPSGENAHWEVWWSQADYTWPQLTYPFKGPEVQIDYFFDFGGTSCWGCTFEYLICLGDICAGPFQERIFAYWGPGEKPLVGFPSPHAGEVVVPGERFTKTQLLCNYDDIPHVYTLTYNSSESWGYEVYTREQTTGGSVPTVNTIQLDANSTNECKYIELAYTTNETDTVDIVLITATAQMSPDVYAQTFNLVFTPWATPTIGWDAYLPAIMKNHTSTVSAGQE